MIIRRIGPLSCAKVMGAVYASLGLIFGALISVITLVASVSPAAHAGHVSPVFRVLFGTGAILFLPIFYGVIGFVSALVGAWVYNLAASRVGGIAIDIS